jgi:hypothetical protein
VLDASKIRDGRVYAIELRNFPRPKMTAEEAKQAKGAVYKSGLWKLDQHIKCKSDDERTMRQMTTASVLLGAKSKFRPETSWFKDQGNMPNNHDANTITTVSSVLTERTHDATVSVYIVESRPIPYGKGPPRILSQTPKYEQESQEFFEELKSKLVPINQFEKFYPSNSRLIKPTDDPKVDTADRPSTDNQIVPAETRTPVTVNNEKEKGPNEPETLQILDENKDNNPSPYRAPNWRCRKRHIQ